LAYISPTTLAELLAARAAHPQAQVVAGCTDVGLWVTKLHRQLAQVLDVTRAAELRRIDDTPEHIAIGAAVTLTEAPLPPSPPSGRSWPTFATPLCRACPCATRARWAATWPTARPLATPCRC
jgi:xanthine dehydrogenase iron-sulfur cluster and FAD-binding subunit A